MINVIRSVSLILRCAKFYICFLGMPFEGLMALAFFSVGGDDLRCECFDLGAWSSMEQIQLVSQGTAEFKPSGAFCKFYLSRSEIGKLLTHLCPLVVHEVNGQDGVHLLSAAEVDELILKADQAAEEAATPALADEAARSPSGREIPAANADEAEAEAGSEAGSGEPAASPRDRRVPPEHPSAPDPETSAPEPSPASHPVRDKRRAEGGAAATAAKDKKACKCCIVM
ncbi:paralemmin 1a [Festucalex cinctus]